MTTHTNIPNNHFDCTSDLLYDFSNDIHYNHIADVLGGEDFLKSNYPTVYQALERTREMHLKEKPCVSLNLNEDDRKDDLDVDFINFGEEKNISASKNNDSFIVETGISANFIDLKSNITITGFLEDKDETIFLPLNQYTTNSHCLNYEDSIIANDYVKNTPIDFNCEVDVLWSSPKNNKPTLQAEHLIYEKSFFTKDSDDYIVNNVDVTAPMNSISHGECTIIVYERRDCDQFDYKYTNTLESNGKICNMHFPFTGSVTVNEGYEVISIDRNNVKFKISVSLTDNHGVAEFDIHNSYNITNFYTISPSKRELSWNFPDDWKSKVVVSIFGGSYEPILYFHARLPIKIKDITTQQYTTVYLDINSLPMKLKSNPCSKQIPPILLYWGCLGKDTKIKMFNGNEKKISDIRINDEVLSTTGSKIIVKNIITGTEKKLLHIETYGGRVLLATGSHPILTEHGFTRGFDLNALDNIQIKDGFDQIKYLYPIDYNDTVYSLQFDGLNSMFCNGLICGDFNIQNNLIPRTSNLDLEKPNYSKEMLDFQNEFKELSIILKERRMSKHV